MKQFQQRSDTRAPHGQPESDVSYSFRCSKDFRAALNAAGGCIWVRKVLAKAVEKKLGAHNP